MATEGFRRWWAAALGVNLLFGVPCIVPVWLFWYFLSNWPLADLGMTMREPTENDGMLPWMMFGGPIVVGSLMLWWLINFSLRRRVRTRSRVYWPVSALTALVPSITLMIGLPV
ncbi:hypothetical protein ACFVW2_08050 [Streptomyces sp. NPDC058171]